MPRSPPSTPLTVLITVPTLDAGAADDGVLELVRVLVQARHRPIVVSRGGRRQDEVAASGGVFVACDVASKNPLVMTRNCIRLVRLMRRERCDLVHAHGRAPGWSAYIAARMAGLPFVTTWYKGFRDQNPFKRLYNSVMARGDHVIAVTPRLGELVRRRYGVPPHRVAVIPRLVDLSAFDPVDVDAARIAAVRQGWGVSPETKVILVVGRMLRRKGHHVMVRAMQILRQRGMQNVMCIFIGEDPGRSRYLGELWDLVLATGTSEVVRTIGPAQDLPAAYAAATVVISAATQPEGLQRSILEAHAMGRPVIVSDQAGSPAAEPSCRTVAVDRMTGLCVPAGDAAELAAALVRVLALPEPQRQAMGARGRELVASNIRLEDAAQSLLRLYAEAVRPYETPQLQRR